MKSTEVLAVEIRQFASDGDSPLRTLVPRVIGQSEIDRRAKAYTQVAGRSHPISRDELVDQTSADEREIALAILHAAEMSGFVISEVQASSKPFARIQLPGISGSPVNLSHEFLWVSLGRHHPILREEPTNSEIRRAVLRISPTCTRANDPHKGEVGIRLDTIGQDGRDHLPALFETMKHALMGPQSPKS